MKQKITLSSLVLVALLGGLYFVLSRSQKEPVKSQPKVTFIELGSVHCIPCRKMEPVLESIRKKFPDDVKVVFHDVWTKEGKPFGTKYGIHSIPTQIFLDKNGKEYYRHVGFFPEKEVIKILKKLLK